MWKEVTTLQPHRVEEARRGIQLVARDHARCPMQWTNGPQAGFSTQPNTWMKVMDSYTDINVEEQDGRDDSILEFYRMLLKLRKEMGNLFIYGRFELFDKDNEKTMVYTKTADDKVALIGLSKFFLSFHRFEEFH